MKKNIYILFLLVSLFIFGYKVNALSVPGDGSWHVIDYNTLINEETKDQKVRGEVTSCTANGSNIEAVVYTSGTTNTCMIRSKEVTNSDVNASITVTWNYGPTRNNKTTLNTTILSSNSSSGNSASSSTVKDEKTKPDDYFAICDPSTNPQLVASFKLIGIFVNIVKIIVPIILIIMGSLDITKAVIDKNDGAIQKSLIVFLKRSIAGVLVFLAPSVILGIFHSIDGLDNFDSGYSTCVDCILGSSSCPNVKFINTES